MCVAVREHATGMVEGIFSDGTTWLSGMPWLLHQQTVRDREAAAVLRKPAVAERTAAAKRPAAGAANSESQASEEGSGEAGAQDVSETDLKRERHRLCSKAYHGARSAALRAGESPATAKQKAQAAAAEAASAFDAQRA